MIQEEILLEHIDGALKALGSPFDTADELTETVHRIARVWIEMTEGLFKEPPNIKWFKTKSRGFLLKGPVESYALCPHHLLPVTLKILVGLVPNGYTIGISKITRVALWASKRLAIQEDITKIMAGILWEVEEIYRPSGVIVGIIGDHYCEKIRGVQHPSPTITTEIRGYIEKDFITVFQNHMGNIKL